MVVELLWFFMVEHFLIVVQYTAVAGSGGAGSDGTGKDGGDGGTRCLRQYLSYDADSQGPDNT